MDVIKRLAAIEPDYPVLASVFREHWETRLDEYSRVLFDKSPAAVEPELKESFREEWRESGVPEERISVLLEQLERLPVLQTSHHVTPTNGPTFLALDIISLAGIPEEDTYMVAANSGVAFSNTAWSGALSFGSLPLEALLVKDSAAYKKTLTSIRNRHADGDMDRRISLIPSRQRDRLVYGAAVEGYTERIHADLSEEAARIIPLPREGQDYSLWACGCCEEIQRTILNRQNILYFDINRVMSRYLVKVLCGESGHPLQELFGDTSLLERVNRIFQEPAFFLSSYKGKKSLKVELLKWNGKGVHGPKTGFVQHDKTSLVKELEEKRYCPGLFLQFLVLYFLNNIRCLGSFNQVEYLDGFRRKWREVGTPWELDLVSHSREMLTTGRLLRNGGEVWPLDMAIAGEFITIEAFGEKRMSCFWEPILRTLSIKR